MKMKKIIAWMATVAMISSMFISTASAAWATIDSITYDSTAKTVTIALPTDFDFDANETVRISVSKDWAAYGLDSNNITAATIWSEDVDTIAWNTAWGNASLTNAADAAAGEDIVLTFNDILPKGNYSFSVSWNWTYWAIMLYVDNANQVSISADIEPILSMELKNPTIAFWTLTPNTIKQSTASVDPENIVNLATQSWEPLYATSYKTKAETIWTNTNTFVKISTNAIDWYVVNVKNTWLKFWSNAVATAQASTASDLTLTDDNAWVEWNWKTLEIKCNDGLNATATLVTDDAHDSIVEIDCDWSNNSTWANISDAINWASNFAVSAASTTETDALSAQVLTLANWTSAYEIPAVAWWNHNTEAIWTADTWYGYWINAYTLYDWETIDWTVSKVSAISKTWTNYWWSLITAWNNVTVWAMSTSTTPLVSATWPVSNQVTAVQFFAKVSPMQPAWNYTDVVTFTVTWNF